jgi:diguanylate cyclase (GGDEF)-like protein
MNYSLNIATRILKVIQEKPIKANNHLINITISIGINPYPEKSKNIENAIKIADEQLYKAKENGRNRVVVG